MAADARSERHGPEGVMRHFLALALAKVLLALGVLPATGERGLKALAGSARARAPRLATARLGAIPLPMVAALADTLLRVAPRAVEQPVADLADGSTSSSQRLDSARRSRHCLLGTSAINTQRAPPRRLEAVTSGLHLFRSLALLSRRRCADHRAAHVPHARRCSGRKEREEIQSDLRRRWFETQTKPW